MQRILGLLSLLLIIAAANTLQAQQPPQKRAVLRPGTATFLAPFVPPVPGAPVTATYAIEVEQPLAGGATETLHSITRIARDSQGRVRHELHAYVPASQPGEPPLMFVILTDPVARLSHILDIDRRIDTRLWFHASHANLSAPGATTEDLGSKTVGDFTTTGERRTWLGSSDTSGQALRKEDEIWYSNELQLRVSEQRRSFSGVVMRITLARVDSGESDAALFKVPHGYHVPAMGARVATSPPAVTPPDYDPSGFEGCCVIPGISR